MIVFQNHLFNFGKQIKTLKSSIIMANTYHKMYIQCVFAVKYRNAVIDKSWRPQLMAVFGNLINETGCQNLIVNGIEDHVHCFFKLMPNIEVSNIMPVSYTHLTL